MSINTEKNKTGKPLVLPQPDKSDTELLSGQIDTGFKNQAPMHLDKMMTVVEIKAWIALATVLIILATVVFWGFFGSMQMREDVTGVLVKSGKTVNIFATDDCVLLDFTLMPEDYVEKDQVVARIEQLELVNEINLMIAEGSPDIEIEAKRQELIGKSQIMTPEGGRVVDTYVHAGDYVKKGTKIATISKEAPNQKAMECLLFVSASRIKNIKKSQNVNIYPSSVNRKTYGNMTGMVSFIGEYPVTEQYLIGALGSEELAREFLKNGACYEVSISLISSEETVTGYKWSTSMGPSKKFGNLTLCDASVIISELRPIDVFFFDN